MVVVRGGWVVLPAEVLGHVGQKKRPPPPPHTQKNPSPSRGALWSPQSGRSRVTMALTALDLGKLILGPEGPP